MKIVLEHMLINDDIYKNVNNYLNKKRIKHSLVNRDVFGKVDYGGFIFASDVFQRRVQEVLNTLSIPSASSYGDLIHSIPDIETYNDHNKPSELMNLHIIISDENDVVILAIDPRSPAEDMAQASWMGLFYDGDGSNFLKLMYELQIDLEQCMNDHLLKPKPAPEGYDHNLSVVENAKKVCCEEDTTPHEIGSLIEFLLDPPEERLHRYVLTEEESSYITYEDIWFPIDDTEYNGIIYRDQRDERKTYVIIYNRTTNKVHCAFVGDSSDKDGYILIEDPCVIHNVYLSVVHELR